MSPKVKKIDMDKRAKEFREEVGSVNPVAGYILATKQLWKVECKECGTVFECAEGSEAFENELCEDCR